MHISIEMIFFSLFQKQRDCESEEKKCHSSVNQVHGPDLKNRNHSSKNIPFSSY